MGRKRKLIDKQVFKRMEGKCRICGEERYGLLDVHRWHTPGKDFGSYTRYNSIVLCCACHRLIHGEHPEVIIQGCHFCTDGTYKYLIERNGKEEFI